MGIEKQNLVKLRSFKIEDRNFILATWLRGLRFGNDWYEAIPSDLYYEVYHQIVDAILLDPSVDIKVACLKDDEDVILGYSVYSGSRVDWVFVKQAWRKIGIAKSLLPPSIKTISHLTKCANTWLKNHTDVEFHPVTWVSKKNKRKEDDSNVRN